MRRIITIIVILIIITGVVLGVLWLSARNKAVKNGTSKPTFREFVTGDVRSGQPTTNPGGTLTSDFANPSANTDELAPSPTSPSIDSSLTAPGTQSSTFTNDTYTPTSPNGGTIGTSNQTTPTSTQTADTTPTGTSVNTSTPSQGGSTTTGNGTLPNTPSSTNTPVLQCSDADVNIVFTPQELDELKTLERRFYTIAESIRTDEDIAREISNHDTFALKGQQITELYNYCIQKSDRLTSPLYQRRVPTPFWNDPRTDKPGFITEATKQPAALNTINTRTFDYGKQRIEYALKLNLW